jgi:DHA1 family bicyclomycin/chloramphenicol resistance-like MFS transporter
VFAFMVLCGLAFAFASWWRLPETLPAAARIPFNGRNLVSTSLTVLRHPEFIMLAMAAALNFNSIACFIGSAPAIIETHWGLGETSYWMLFLPVITGILIGAIIAGYTAGRFDLVFQVRVGFGLTFSVTLVRVALHLLLGQIPIPVQQGLLLVGAIGAQFAFPILTLRMLDLFPAARGTAASAQSFVALLFTAFTLGVIAPKVLPHLQWIAFASLGFTVLAVCCWYLSRRWHDRAIPHAA